MGFDQLPFGSDTKHYFNGVIEALRIAGVAVHTPSLPPIASIEKRAEKLRQFVSALPARKVHLIAHSMGGLDARCAIHLGIGDKVASLTTIGAPHRGSPIANALLGRMLKGVGIGAIADLSPIAAARFNDRVPDHPRVRYQSVVSTCEENDQMNQVLRPLANLLNHIAGPNDGIVPASSQAWGHVIERIHADHWGQIGWSKHYDAKALYLRLAKGLRARGG